MPPARSLTCTWSPAAGATATLNLSTLSRKQARSCSAVSALGHDGDGFRPACPADPTPTAPVLAGRRRARYRVPRARRLSPVV